MISTATQQGGDEDGERRARTEHRSQSLPRMRSGGEKKAKKSDGSVLHMRHVKVGRQTYLRCFCEILTRTKIFWEFYATDRRAVRCSCMKHQNHPQRSRAKSHHRSTLKRKRNAWLLPFASLLREVAPSGFQVLVEVLLGLEPPRADILILRRGKKAPRQGRLFRRLWPRLRKYTVLEYKSPLDSSFRRGDLIRLVSYGTLYHCRHVKDMFCSDELTLVLVVAGLTQALFDEIERMGWTFEPMEGGYARIKGVMYPCYVVVIDEVCQEERSELLRVFSHHPVTDPLVQQWISQWQKENDMRPSRSKFAQGNRELIRLILLDKKSEGRLGQTLLEEVPREELIVKLPIDVLRGLSPDYLQTLPEEVQRKVQARLRTFARKQRAAAKQASALTATALPAAPRRTRRAA